MANLPYRIKWQAVKDLFRQSLGAAPYVELFSNEDGRPTGCGLVTFPTEELAKKAVEKMHHSEVQSKPQKYSTNSLKILGFGGIMLDAFFKKRINFLSGILK